VDAARSPRSGPPDTNHPTATAFWPTCRPSNRHAPSSPAERTYGQSFGAEHAATLVLLAAHDTIARVADGASVSLAVAAMRAGLSAELADPAWRHRGVALVTGLHTDLTNAPSGIGTSIARATPEQLEAFELPTRALDRLRQDAAHMLHPDAVALLVAHDGRLHRAAVSPWRPSGTRRGRVRPLRRVPCGQSEHPGLLPRPADQRALTATLAHRLALLAGNVTDGGVGASRHPVAVAGASARTAPPRSARPLGSWPESGPDRPPGPSPVRQGLP
jgi:hypothetical protein